jgi:predicted nucleic acid-binding protein
MTDKPKVYIETSIPSFYYEDRQDAAAVARREWTQQWWDHQRHHYELVSSQAVWDELKEGNYPKQAKCLAFIKKLPFLTMASEISLIVQTYLQHKLMLKEAEGDVLHLALASYHKCDILLTWNCRHLANVNKVKHIRYVNTSLRLYVPNITTPLELLGEQYE